jgi:PPOX class probable F420-dependent enzyme
VSAALTNEQIELLRGHGFGVVATLNPEGAPQTSVVWVDTDGAHVIFNTTNGRAKARHIRRDPRVSVTVYDGDDSSRYFEVEGTAELELDGAEDHIEELSQRYDGRDFTGARDRVIVKVTPKRIFDHLE